MVSIYRSALFIILLISLACAAVEPAITAEELRIFRNHLSGYYRAYQFAPAGGTREIPYLTHLSPAHQTLEQDALQHARARGNGPFLIDRGKGAVYVSTRVLNNSPLATKWNLAQRDANNALQAYDAHLFWRINKDGPRLYRLNIFHAGAELQEQLSMEDAINRGRRQRRGGECLGCF